MEISTVGVKGNVKVEATVLTKECFVADLKDDCLVFLMAALTEHLRVEQKDIK